MDLKKVNLSQISKEINRPKQDTDLSLGKQAIDDFDIESIEILPEYKLILNELEQKNTIIFVSGRAGTGKSTLIHYIRAKLDKCAVVAPTAIAAINVGGTTIHSFFSMPPRVLNPDEDFPLRSNMVPVIEDLSVLIIDEISMVSPNMIDVINNSLKKARKSDLPFGGVSIVFVGDLLQLPPIVNDKDVGVFYTHRYNSPYFYSADIFSEAEILPIELTKVFRQKDKEFIDILNHIRINNRHREAVARINRECYLDKLEKVNDNISLVTTNAMAKTINEKKLKEIAGDLLTFEAKYSGTLKQNQIHFPAPDILNLKIGAKIVFVKNNKPLWLNGTMGTVVGIEDDFLLVQIDETKNIVSVGIETWDKVKYTYNYETRKIESVSIGSFSQFPITLGWAVTIHKSQGMTIEKLNIDLGNGAFAFGQSYVALSRCKTLEGITLFKPISMSDVKADPTVLEFYNRLGFSGYDFAIGNKNNKRHI